MNVLMKRHKGETFATILTAERIVGAWLIRSFNRDQLITLREGCREIMRRLSNDRPLPNPEHGICKNLATLCEGLRKDVDAYYFVSTCSAYWEHSVGVLGVPTVSPIPLSLTKPWEGQHLNLRLDLLNHLVACADLMLYHLDMEARVHDF